MPEVALDGQKRLKAARLLLIGAGGLGSFVFEGLGQYAADLVLLGALPTIALALAADFLLQLLASLLRRRVAT